MTVTYLPDSSPVPRVAFAVGRRVGPAVVRNRCRRRLRAVLAELAGGPTPVLRPGAYLFSVAPGAVSLSHQELHRTVRSALDRLPRATPDQTERH